MALDKFNPGQTGSGLKALLPFLFYAMLAATLMVVDGRAGISAAIRSTASDVFSPLWWVASQPYAFWQKGIGAFNTNADLRDKVAGLEKEQLKSNLALQQMLAVQSENAELRGLLLAKNRFATQARLVELLSIHPEPSQKRYIIDRGSRQMVKPGQVLIDAKGLVGQVAEVYPASSVVIAITDADHAVPVMVARSGFRSIVLGQGNDNRLAMANLTASDDVKKGDVLLTSGIGGVFPPGIPVGIVTAFQQDHAMTFLSAQVMPLARPTYGRYLLLLDTYTSRTKATPETDLKPTMTPGNNPAEMQSTRSMENKKPVPLPPSKAMGESAPVPGNPAVDKSEPKP